jgi:hypothetical protein
MMDDQPIHFAPIAAGTIAADQPPAWTADCRSWTFVITQVGEKYVASANDNRSPRLTIIKLGANFITLQDAQEACRNFAANTADEGDRR